MSSTHTSDTVGTAQRTQFQLDAILRICSNLTAPRPLDETLDDLLREARSIVRADAGSLYLRENGGLRFVCRQMGDELPRSRGATLPGLARLSRPDPLAGAVSRDSVAHHVAESGRPLNVVNVYELPPDAPFQFDSSYDARTGYRTVSMLVVPMNDPNGPTVGVLQMINHRGESGEITAFSRRDERTLASVAAVAAVTVRNAQLHEQLYQSHLDTILHLANAAEFRDGDTGSHIRRMSCYSEALARSLDRSPEWCRRILFAAAMHDVGKLGVPDAILGKPGPLTADERSVMQRHTLIGAQILHGSSNEILTMAEGIALGHHEHWDGSGYPNGAKGDGIPEEARITAIADVFDALTNRRVYKPAFSLDEAFQLMQKESGRHFDPKMLDAFVAAREEIAAIYDAYRDD